MGETPVFRVQKVRFAQALTVAGGVSIIMQKFGDNRRPLNTTPAPSHRRRDSGTPQVTTGVVVNPTPLAPRFILGRKRPEMDLHQNYLEYIRSNLFKTAVRTVLVNIRMVANFGANGASELASTIENLSPFLASLKSPHQKTSKI